MENKMNVLFLTKYSAQGASSRYRFYNYKNYFTEKGINPKFMPLFGDQYLKALYSKNTLLKNIFAIYFILRRFCFLFFNISKYDHIVMEAELFPYFPFKFDHYFIAKMKSFSIDFDDNISANYQSTSNKDKIPKLINLAKFVTVGNHWYFTEFKGNLIYLPTVIDLNQYPCYEIKNKDLSLVWIGSKSTVRYLKLLEETLIKLSDKYEFTLNIIGGNIKLHDKIKVAYIPWSSETENKNLATSSIGIMPLENTFWARGKCGFKLIQYMASGLCVVGSALPANEEIILNNSNGFIADTQEDWFKYLDVLLADEDLRLKMGAESRHRVEQYYSYQVWGEKYANIIIENA